MKTLDYILSRDTNLASRLGLSLKSPCLGNGVVFRTASGTAVKYTGELEEAQVARELVGQRLKHVVRVFNVHALPRGWLVHMEALVPAKVAAAHRRRAFEEGARELFRATGRLYTDMIQENLMHCPKTEYLKIVDFEEMELCSPREFERRLQEIL